jgi:hypothetical protein
VIAGSAKLDLEGQTLNLKAGPLRVGAGSRPQIDTSRGKERSFCHGLFLSHTELRWLLKPPLLPASISLDRGDEERRPRQLRKLGGRAS